ncbi:uncharacterized protein PAC_17732 [Phialocephala subalpina]|uniref:DUF2235 domain-containing protein n=1 Tax=Phialocephala subalpina TaxID=576137 RepID=A0A1L7XS04_9HELO|nr:uncharacterized protein PAC_17732 [Phialocephala subalpina]
MDQDGSIAQRTDATSNVFRIWQLVPLEKKIRDANGKIWLQKRAEFITGVGASAGMVASVFGGVAGRGETGCDAKIKEVYKECCKLCPSKDELFMFGFSRGAFITRAVAGMLQHLGALRADSREFDDEFVKALTIWRDLRGNLPGRSNTIEWFRNQYTRDSPRIQFLGAFDTVKAFNDSGLNDIGLLHNIFHVRHAMALFERRMEYKLERFLLHKEVDEYDHDKRSFQEAWFAGVHGNLGGACEDDGLSLWPLQWILSEAQKFGLGLGFTAAPNLTTLNPANLIFPSVRTLNKSVLPKLSEQLQSICFSNGIEVSMDDLSNVFEEPGYAPRFPVNERWVGTKDREIFNHGKLIGRVDDKKNPFGTFIHPSVFFMDNTQAYMIRAISKLSYAKILREQESFVCEDHRKYWNVTSTIMQKREPEKPRILICGPSGTGKSSLINKFLNQSVTEVSHGASAGNHDIRVPFGGGDSPYLIHDSNGWQSGEKENFEDIQAFLKESRSRDLLQDQLHCVWFCSSLENPRITPTDRELLKLDFGEVPLILVFTKLDLLKSNMKKEVLDEILSENPRIEQDSPNVDEISSLPSSYQPDANARLEALMDRKKNEIIEQWEKKDVKPESLALNYKFVSVTRGYVYADSINDLRKASYDAMTGPRISKIHAEAQRIWIDKKLKKAIKDLADLWEKRRPTLDSSNTQKLIDKFGKNAMRVTNNAFEYEGYQSDMHSDLIRNLIYPSVEEKNWLKTITSAATSAATYAPGVAAYLSPGPSRVVSGVAAIAATATTNRARAYETARRLVRECVDVLLIFERIYWYDGRHINDEFVRGACCYYLKFQSAVHDEVGSKSGWISDGLGMLVSKEDVEKTLTSVVNEFRYRNRLTETALEDNETGAMPVNFPQDV